MQPWPENRKKAIFYFSKYSVSLSQSSVDIIGKLKAIGKITSFAISQGWLRMAMIGQTLLSWFCSTRLTFSYLYHAIMNFQKISKSHFRVLLTQQQCSKFQNFWLCTKNVIETRKCTQAATPLFFWSISNFPWQLWGAITFEQVLILCWHFQNNLISYIPFIWKSFIQIWVGSWPVLVHLTWPCSCGLYFSQMLLIRLLV